MGSEMNSYLCAGLKDNNSLSFSSKQTVEKINGQHVYKKQHQQEKHAQYKAKKAVEPELSFMRSISNPNCDSSCYQNHDTKRLFNEVSEMRLKEKRSQSEDDFTNQTKSSSTTERLRKFLIKHADFLNTLYHNDDNDDERQQQQSNKQENLPAELWWVPPLNLPTSRSVPSVNQSSTDYSATNSFVSHPKTRRSVEDLRQRVDSVCNLVESMGIMEHDLQLNSPKIDCVSASCSEFCPVPSLRLSSRSDQPSLREEVNKQQISHKNVGSQCSAIEPKSSSDCNNTGSATLRIQLQNSINPEMILHSPVDCESASNVEHRNSPESNSTHFQLPQSCLSVSDLACIHIVNPMLSKLARLCTAQGQQYLTVLEELEKACNDFHNACKSQAASK